ncbi:MAG: Vms1/Ankzf1 family peptidyl-tRNA hydrolase [Rhodothermales bacterium]|nr:Vms1/Ankzf1 family peptidyl-tRNA hydrolase [Rhodothermales bacterium]
MTFADLDLQELAELEGPERAFLTAYLSGPDAKARLHHRLKTLRALVADHEAEREHLEQNVTLLDAMLDGLDLSAPSTALFVCWALDVQASLPLSVEVPETVWVGPSPYLRPLAELQDEYEDFAVAVIDNERAEVFLVRAAVAEKEGRVRGDVKNRVKKGGWSQQRYARRREKELERYASDVAETLTELHEREAFSRLILLGQTEARTALEEALTQPLRDRLVGEGSVDTDDADAVLREAFRLYFEEEQASERRLWDRIREGYMTGGLAAVGPQRVLAAAQEGRVEAALVERDADLTGTKCRDCSHSVYGTPETCQRCGSKDVFTLDYVNELVEALARTGAEADFTDPFEALTSVGRVAAALRW